MVCVDWWCSEFYLGLRPWFDCCFAFVLLLRFDMFAICVCEFKWVWFDLVFCSCIWGLSWLLLYCYELWIIEVCCFWFSVLIMGLVFDRLICVCGTVWDFSWSCFVFCGCWLVILCLCCGLMALSSYFLCCLVVGIMLIVSFDVACGFVFCFVFVVL